MPDSRLIGWSLWTARNETAYPEAWGVITDSRIEGDQIVFCTEDREFSFNLPDSPGAIRFVAKDGLIGKVLPPPSV